MKRITILAAMHGTETYGIDLYNAFVEAHPVLADHVQLIIGNELAYEKKVRYIDVDMNRHYGQVGTSHESKEIGRVEALLESFAPDYIIDVHTTKRDSGVFFISDEPNDIRRAIFDMLTIDVCVMKDSVVKSSFIGAHGNAVSLEYSLKSISEYTTDTFLSALANLIEEKPGEGQGTVYNVSKLISKDDWAKYAGIKNYDEKAEGVALMVPVDNSEMDAEYYGFWCKPAKV